MSAARKLTVIRGRKAPKPAKLRAKPNAKLDVHKLPFVGLEHHAKTEPGLSFWDVPLQGGYAGGLETGEAAALMYLKFLRKDQGSDCVSELFALGSILASMVDRRPSDQSDQKALKGQVMGFSGVLSRWLKASLREFGKNLDNVDHDWLLAKANFGFDQQQAESSLFASIERAGDDHGQC